MADDHKKMAIPEAYACVVRMERSEKLKSKIIVIVLGFVLAAVSISVMTAFTYRSLREIRHLNEEIEILKQERFSSEVIKHLKMEIDLLKITVKRVVNAVQMQYEYDEYTEDGENPNDLQYTEADDYYDYDNTSGSDDSEDDGSDDENSDNASSQNDIIISGENLVTILKGGLLTKDLKDARNPEREKRNVEGHNDDAVPVNGESFPGPRRRNNTSRRQRHRHQHTTAPSTENDSQGLTPRAQIAGTVENTTKSMFSSELQNQDDDIFRASRQVIKKSSPEEQEGSVESSDVEVVQTKRQTRWPRIKHRNLESLDETHPSTYPRTGRMRPLPTAHFDGDTSKYVLGQHTNFNGNGHLKHPSRTYVDWVEANWFKTLGMDRHFTLNEGVLTIKESGIYFVYAQIYYLDKHDTNGFRVYKNDDTFLQCTTMTHSIDVVMKGNTCYTAAANYLHEGDRIYLMDLSESRYSLFEPGKSFFGAIKLGDVRIK